jgi:hypothetical protein
MNIPPAPARLVRLASGFVLCLILPPLIFSQNVTNLDGQWRFQFDRTNVGADQQWFARALAGQCQLPGSLPAQGLGEDITVETKWTGGIFDKSWFTAPEFAPYRQPGNLKIPFWLQPEKHYVGAAWFQRDLEVPAAWVGRRLVLTLERPHWKTAVWLDERALGSDDALSVPHEYDLGTGVSPGRHVLTIRVDNTLDPDIGENSHSVSDHTQGNWNGIVGRMEITATAPVWIDELQVYGRLRDRVAVVHGVVRSADGRPLPGKVHLAAGPAGATSCPVIDARLAPDGSFSAEYALGANASLWDEFSPALLRLSASLDNGERRDTVFGLREIAASGRQLTINGRKLFLRGTLECAAFPRTGHPPLDVAAWKREFGVMRAHGLNHARFHSWCPPEAAFVAADELGIYLQIEVASWPNWSTTLGDGRPVDAWLEAETRRILRAYGNHPSFVMLCSSNEPGGKAYAPWLARWVATQKLQDPRRLYTSAAGWPELPENDYDVRPDPRIQHWAEGLDSRINQLPPETRTDYSAFIQRHSVPVVSHEIGQWCAYPNFAEMPKYTGYLKPRNFEIFRASLEARHLLGQAHDFLIASGKLQALCYKEEIESALRTPEMGGFQLLGLSDFPGQGTALVGVVDAFWDDKGYISPAEFRRFCNSTVPLARLDRRVFATDEHLTAELDIAHFGPAPLARAVVAWQIVGDDGRVAASGSLAPRDIPLGAGVALGRIDVALATLPAPARYKLVVSIEGTAFSNDWDVWVYPPADQIPAAAPANVTIVHQWDAAAESALEAGGAVVLMIPPDRVRPDPHKGGIALGFSSIFWNTAWTNGQAPHTLGILCDPKQPALASFPTETWSNWQWWYPVTHAAAMILDELPAAVAPIVQVIPDWNANHKLALAFEARVGSGKLLVTSIDLDGSALDPVRRQLRASLLAYAASPAFRPTTVLSPEQIRQLIVP